MLPSTNRHWEVTDELLNESGTCGMPLHKRLRRVIIRRDQLRLHRLELVAIDAALDETRDALSQQNKRSLLVRLAEIEADVEQQSQSLLQGSRIVLPWADLEKLRSEVSLAPSTKPYGNQ
jgi:hypothetical protein